MNKPVSVYTDGSCNGNPGPGGWAAILKRGRWQKEIVGSTPHGSNNRMELQAVIAGLSAVRPGSRVTVYSDSQYVVDAINAGRVPTLIFQWKAVFFFDSYLIVISSKKVEKSYQK